MRILGGADPARSTLGRLPASWLVEPFGARAPADFLAAIDFFVFHHHPRWVEPLGRAAMEALASGAVAILPEYMRASFGDAAIYAPATSVRAIAMEMSADREAYRAQSKLGQDIVAALHNYGVHHERLAALIGPPATSGRSELDPDVGDRLGSPVASALASFRPLFVIDTGDFAPLRRRGYVVERVMREDELTAANPRDAYGEYLFSRLSSITRDYGAASVVPLPAGDPGALGGPLSQLVGAIDTPRAAAQYQVRATRSSSATKRPAWVAQS